MSASPFDLHGRVVVVTGGAGLLGRQHILAIAGAGGIPVAIDIDEVGLRTLAEQLESRGASHLMIVGDVTSDRVVKSIFEQVLAKYGRVWGLVNNVAANPSMRSGEEVASLSSTLESEWDADLRLGLTSAWLCGRQFGGHMSEMGGGTIVNVASDLAVIAPDQRVYRHDAPPGKDSPKKPASYSATKGGIRMLSKYFATYWAPTPVRSNCLIPGSVKGSQSEDLTRELEYRIPLGRLAEPHEYQGAINFLLSDASAYMTGAELVMDGGRSAW